ncbi:MAG: DUF5615 family PIN-like protein [Desulfotomaculaceae bacterium]|nr:DUF5615 family PIN-like protein [Desulfotomaculaceae bacterium]
MKFLADMGISNRTVEWLRQKGYDAIHLREEGLQRLSDQDVLLKAQRENRTILTMDLDFGYLVATSERNLPSIIIFRLSDERSEVVNRRLEKVLILCKHDIDAGVIISVNEKSIRARRLPF